MEAPQSEARVTRSRARVLEQAGGHTPLVAPLAAKMPATRRKTAAKAKQAPLADEGAAAAVQPVQHARLLDAEAVAPAPAAEEPPATPAPSVHASPKAQVPAATPTGLGLSTLQPISPLSAAPPASRTPVVTPLAGVPPAGVADALHAAAQALGGALPAPAPEAQGPQGGSGFGSPVRAADSPPQATVSIGAAIGAAAGGGGEEEEEVASESPLSAAGLGAVRFDGPDERDLARMLETPSFWHSAESDDEAPLAAQAPAPEGRPTPTVCAPAAPAAAAAPQPAAAKAPTPVVVRQASVARPLTPSRQVVLEEDAQASGGGGARAAIIVMLQDYVMETSEAAADAAAPEAGEEAISPAPAALAAPSAAAQAAREAEEGEGEGMEAEKAPAPPAAPSPVPAAPAVPALKSKVVASPGSFDPRSLRQLKKEVATKLEERRLAVGGAGEDEGAEEEEEEGHEEEDGEQAGELADALGALCLGGGMAGPLRGLPTPAGVHIRFDDAGEPEASPRQRLHLRGLPEPEGRHIRFGD
eukprot:scaffold12.g8063.t1